MTNRATRRQLGTDPNAKRGDNFAVLGGGVVQLTEEFSITAMPPIKPLAAWEVLHDRMDDAGCNVFVLVHQTDSEIKVLAGRTEHVQ